MTMSGLKTKYRDGTGAIKNDDDYQNFVHNVPEPDPSRPGWLRQMAPGDDGSFISWPAKSRPKIHFKVDGPMLVCRNGEIFFLTYWQRLLLWLGRADALSLEFKYRPYLNPAMDR